jgi:hypothetical protein
MSVQEPINRPIVHLKANHNFIAHARYALFKLHNVGYGAFKSILWHHFWIYLRANVSCGYVAL